MKFISKGSGTGTFTSATSVTVGSSPWTLGGIRVGDFNADGKVDLVISNYKGLFVLWDNGGNFYSPSPKWAVRITALGLRRLTSTRMVSLTCWWCTTPVKWKGCCGRELHALESLSGKGQQNFKQTWNINLPYTFQGLWGTTAADINGDGINDIVGIAGVSLLYVWLGNSDGTYQTTPLSFQSQQLVGLRPGSQRLQSGWKD